MNEGSDNTYAELERLTSALQELLEEVPLKRFPMIGYLLELARMEAVDNIATFKRRDVPPQ